MVELDLKAQGNAEFKRGAFLKAAGLYTRAIKEDPDNAVLYSNRSAALLKLNKVQKALADAESAIQRDAQWDKGYFRKAAALEALDRTSEAADCYQRAAELNPCSGEVAAKVKSLGRQLQQSHPLKTQVSPTAAAGNDLLEQFLQRIVGLARAAVSKGGPQSVQHSVYFWPPKTKEGGAEEQMTQVSISSAFDSPQVLQECLAFLRQTGQEQGFTAACAVINQSQVAFPQVWKRPDWPLPASTEGLFIQLDSLKAKRLLYVPYKDGLLREPQPVKNEFKLLEPLFR